MNKKPKPVDELTRLAFIYGEQDRRAMAEAWPAGSPERKQATLLANQMSDYRKRRWERTALEAMLGEAKPKNVLEMKKP